MATFAERLSQVRQTRDAEASASVKQQEDSDKTNWAAAVEQVKKLVKSEIDITDELPEPERVYRAHTTQEGLFAVVKLDDFWFALPVSDSVATDTKLLGLVHCPNGHVMNLEYPTSADDSWDQAILRIEAAQAVYADTLNCPACMIERSAVRNYQPRTP